MQGDWFYLSFIQFLVNWIYQIMEGVKAVMNMRLERKFSRLEIKAAKLSSLSTMCQTYKSPRCQMKKQIKLERRAEKLTQRIAKLQKRMLYDPELPQGPGQLDQTEGRKWVNEDNDINVLPPAYEDIYHEQPPPYEEVESINKGSLYPVLT